MANVQVVRPRDAAGVVQALVNAGPAAALLAGGTDLMVKMKDGKVSPRVLVDLSGVGETSVIRDEEGSVYVGATVTHSQLLGSALVAEKAPLIREAVATIGSPQIRNRGTIGGNIVTASPAGDTIPALYVLGAEVAIYGPAGKRTAAMDEFFLGPGRTALEPAEMVMGVRIPAMHPGEAGAFVKLGQRNAMAISVVSCAARARLTEVGGLADVRVAFGAVAPTVVRARSAEEALSGLAVRKLMAEMRGGTRPCVSEEVMGICRIAAREVSPITDVRGSADYRRDMAAALLYQAVYRIACTLEGRLGASMAGR